MEKTVREIFEMINNNELRFDQTTQRDFIYGDKTVIVGEGLGEITKAGNVIRAILHKGIKLPAIFFWKKEDGTYNLHDGKQRILSLYYFFYPEKRGLSNFFGFDTCNSKGKAISTVDALTNDEKNKLLDYKFEITVNEGSTEKEEDSFYEINHNAEPLTEYECLRGMLYGKWLTGLEKFYSEHIFDGIVQPKDDRGNQAILFLRAMFDRLEKKESDYKVLKDKIKAWRNEEFNPRVFNLEEKMEIFSELKRRTKMSKTKDKLLIEISFLIFEGMTDTHRKWDCIRIFDFLEKLAKNPNGDVQNKWGLEQFKTAIYLYMNEGKEVDAKRFFDDKKDGIKTLLISICGPYCSECGKSFSIGELEVDHKRPWAKGFPTNKENAQLLCKTHNTSKGKKDWEEYMKENVK